MHAGVSAPDVDTDSPPQYSTLDHGPVIHSTRDWKHIRGEHGPYDNHWTRVVKDGDQTWNQYGINERESDGKPDIYFTCKMMPRKKGNERAIQRCCKKATTSLKSHRSDNYHRCSCTFETLRQPGGPRRCSVRWHHLITRLTKHNVVGYMRAHDMLCSCGCFDVSTTEDFTASGQ